MFNEYESPTKDIPRTRTIDITGNRINITRDDPFGFYTVHFEQGSLPEKLKGNYTSLNEAERAVKQYLSEKKRSIIAPVKTLTKEQLLHPENE